MKFVSEIKQINRVAMVELPYGVNIGEGTYSVEITDLKKNRSLSQNAMLWKLINEISKKENGDYSASWDIYLYLLQKVGAKTIYLTCAEEAVDDLKSLYRDIEVLDHKNGKALVRAYCGSSKMDTQEMSMMIDAALDYAEEAGVDTDYYTKVFEKR